MLFRDFFSKAPLPFILTLLIASGLFGIVEKLNLVDRLASKLRWSKHRTEDTFMWASFIIGQFIAYAIVLLVLYLTEIDLTQWPWDQSEG